MSNQKNYKKFIAYVIILFFSITGFVYAVASNNQEQIKATGGETTSKDGVTISKTIAPTDTENFFDITLKVNTQSKIEEIVKAQDIAVVIVMDISNTMNDPWSSSSDEDKIVSARTAANQFLEKFYAAASKAPQAARKLGFVTFNKDSQEVFGLSECNDQTEYKALKSKIDNITAPSSSTVFWTNMESGLSRAQNMLSKTTIKNQYIIFITDGLPTTYSTEENGYTGYYPQSTYPYPKTFTPGKFYNFVSNSSVWGVNYSDYAARRAEEVAYNIKQEGVKIYSIGVGISNGSTLNSILNDRGGIVFDSDTEANNFAYYSKDSPYKADGGRYFALVPGVKKSYASSSASERKSYYGNTTYYQTWLRNYIGSNEYYDSTAASQLEAAYDEIFADITEMSESATAATWVALDPMGTQGSISNIEFVGLYDDNNKLHTSISIDNDGQSDTASYSTNKNAILWDLKKSSYKEEKDGNITYYSYEVKYRVRLENEKADFDETKLYNTNDETTLTYVIRNNGVLSDNKTLKFKIPSVVGYLGKLEFTKISSYDGRTLEGAEFELIHDETNCTCHNAYLNMKSKKVNIPTMKASSDKNGKVLFNNIPSGHTYKLVETKAPDNHNLPQDNEVMVGVNYGNTTSEIPSTGYKNDIKTGSITLYKIVEGNTTNPGIFQFNLEIYFEGNTIKNEVISLQNGESKTISNLPVGSTYKITETTTNGYKVQFNINKTGEILGDTATCNSSNCSIKEGAVNTVTFTNIAGYILPATGSSGMLILVIIGTLLLVGPVIYIGYSFLKKKED